MVGLLTPNYGINDTIPRLSLTDFWTQSMQPFKLESPAVANNAVDTLPSTPSMGYPWHVAGTRQLKKIKLANWECVSPETGWYG